MALDGVIAILVIYGLAFGALTGIFSLANDDYPTPISKFNHSFKFYWYLFSVVISILGGGFYVLRQAGGSGTSVSIAQD